jgi:hypothetical protein
MDSMKRFRPLAADPFRPLAADVEVLVGGSFRPLAADMRAHADVELSARPVELQISG